VYPERMKHDTGKTTRSDQQSGFVDPPPPIFEPFIGRYPAPNT
jgi:hypothetical protein